MTIAQTFDFAARAVNRALGDVVTWRPGTASEKEIRATFGHGFERVTSGDVRISSRRSEIMVVLSDLPEAPAKGHQVLIREELFEVVNPQQDVEAVSANLVLKKL